MSANKCDPDLAQSNGSENLLTPPHFKIPAVKQSGPKDIYMLVRILVIKLSAFDVSLSFLLNFMVYCEIPS